MSTLWHRLQNLSKCGIFACQVNPFEMKVDESQIRPKHSNVVDVPALCNVYGVHPKNLGVFGKDSPQVLTILAREVHHNSHDDNSIVWAIANLKSYQLILHL